VVKEAKFEAASEAAQHLYQSTACEVKEKRRRYVQVIFLNLGSAKDWETQSGRLRLTLLAR
jgi:hypothetical protein